MKKHNKHLAPERRVEKPRPSFVIKRQEGMSELHRQALEALAREAKRRELAGENTPPEKNLFVVVPFPDHCPAPASPTRECERFSSAQRDSSASNASIYQRAVRFIRASMRFQIITNEILKFCSVPRKLPEIMEHVGLKHRSHTKSRFIDPLIERGFLRMTVPDKPRSILQQYVRTQHSHAT